MTYVSPIRRFGPFVVAVALLVSAACHEEGTIVVKDLSFSGVHAFEPAALTRVLATRKSGWLPWSPRHYFDRDEFQSDLGRIHAYYADHGFPDQRVTGVDVKFSADRKSVRVTIAIDEGPAVIVDEVRFEGFDALPEPARAHLKDAPLRASTPRNRDEVRASRDLAASLLRDHGYPLGYVDAGERPNQTPGHVIVTFRADPGPAMRFGDVAVDGLERVDRSIVMKQVTFKTGDLYRESAVLATQRRLSAVQLFELATVTPRLQQVTADQVPLRITVAEGPPRRLKLGIGYGSEERARGSLEWQHLNFMGSARQLEFAGNASFLDQRVRLSLVEPRLGRSGLTFSVTGVAEATKRLTYDSKTYGGRVSIDYRAERPADASREPVRYDVRVGYANNYLRYGIRAESLSDLSLREERIALGLDPDTGRAAGTSASVDFDLERIATDDLVQPRRGTAVSLHLEHAAPWLGGTYRFDEVLVDARAYASAGPVVLANHVQLGSIGAADPQNVPFAKRYFLGGATTMRGWGRYLVAPLDSQGLPIGGRTLVLLSSEARFPLRGKLSGVAFVDAGNVGSSDWSVEKLRLRVDVGPGLRYQTPIGALRADFGVQLTPIPGLVVNGRSEPRQWRLHLSFGQAF